ncbi:M23 family metallopeptidase [Pseudemcibacter aquimaris]|uniref:M23 family metallopeptidase n=1 Tax=Pseudemcibacter aquimaris TaxID=2857064 RepID=UPI0020128017|nr:peptidoglycan DD-metalloendopeptidase family protein [Pseudemcibacter aquimaris]MCC3861782.1 peptidoglycan DD-metalloendopeptidase family protein [Pseudemcibacter aquimaris]WDU58537.1 peptidoglycan DD-metalloendopeptidase family protein [Pseudemcibacter aquimaris]
MEQVASNAESEETLSNIPVETSISNTAETEPLAKSEASELIDVSNADEIFAKDLIIKNGQGLMDALIDNGAERRDAFNAINALSDHFNVRRIQAGQKMNTEYNAKGTLLSLSFQKDFDTMIVVQRTGDEYQGGLEPLESTIITRHSSGIIDDSLFLAAQRQGLPQATIVELIRIFSYDVDFQREIRKGDQFEVFYERKISEDGRRVQEGDIIYARLNIKGEDIHLYRHTPEGSDYPEYFHEDGQSSKKALMKTPIEGARLSSHYGNRKHPVLGYNRLHKGTDFSAPTGTPIMAAGDGVVERASWFGSFGNYVRIRHNGSYKTIYAHMSKYGRGIKKGARVQQGQIIGYVGATGRVTGRHLHYEVHKDGKAVNPMSLKMPSGIKLNGEPLKKFEMLIANVQGRINDTKTHILLARHDEETDTSVAP